MKEHQRYFPVEQKGALLPYFIALRNGGREHLDVVRYGNEQVIRARFADAAHFVKLDLQKPLEEYLPKLASLTFHAQLGSMLDKVQRLERLVKLLGPAMGLDTKEQATALRIAHLCKADLATRMVVEMTSLQGAMGREYARRSGETEAVAQGIWEHYLPRAAGDALPASAPGTLVGIADRVDTLVALFGVGAEPSGAKDPFALRRTAIGLVQLLAGRALSFDLRRALGQAAGGMPFDVSEETLEDCLSFIATREQILLLGEGHRHDAIEALLAAQAHDPACVWRAVEALEKRMLRKDWPRTLQAYARCARIIRGVEAFAVDSKRLEDKAEKALYDALLKAEAHPRKPGSVEDFFKAFLPLVDDITRFFDEVLVMAEQPQLRENRLALLQRIVALADGVADLSCLEGF
jgi:glycyl-tRNA synthetase